MKANLHLGWPRRSVDEDGRLRLRVRWAAGALALANAVVYALIGVGALRVSDAAEGDAGFLLVFGALSASAFLVGAVLLWAFDRRVLWVLGAAFQAFAMATYVTVAPQRTPPFEVWGLSLKVAQGVLLVALAYLAATREPTRRAVSTRA